MFLNDNSIYINRINRVFDFIDDNLNEPLCLKKLSDIACFSPYHFHRIFRDITGETLNEYVIRQRIEKAAAAILHKENINVGEAAVLYGFNDKASFSRAFKKFYGISPTGFKKQNSSRYSRIEQLKSKNSQQKHAAEKYLCIITNLKQWMAMNAEITVKDLPQMHVAYVTALGVQELAGAFNTLIQWAAPRGLMQGNDFRMLTLYHDSFKVTSADKVRMSACITVNDKALTGGEIGFTTIAGGRHLTGRFKIGLDEFEKSWTGMFMEMNELGFKKADRNPFEIYYNDFNEHPEKKCIVDICIPIT